MAVYIIAEAGVNHNGDINIAKEMIKKAKWAGCDCIKFQTYVTEKLVTMTAPKAEYQIQNTKSENSQFEMLKKLELSQEDFVELKKCCDEVGIEFLSTPFDVEAVGLLEKTGVEQYKISSGDLTNKELLEAVANKNKKVLLSTGMATMDEVHEALTWIHNCGNDDVVLFHCTSNYPAPYESVNMKAMLSLKDEFNVPVGYSDHTQGIEIPIMAVAMGAELIEKHFTLDKTMEGPDHKASLEPDELKKMVESIRHVERALGDGIKQPNESELSTRIAARKSLVYARNLRKDSVLTAEDIVCKRPGNGIAPKCKEDYVGKKLKSDQLGDTLLSSEDFYEE